MFTFNISEEKKSVSIKVVYFIYQNKTLVTNYCKLHDMLTFSLVFAYVQFEFEWQHSVGLDIVFGSDLTLLIMFSVVINVLLSY